MLKKAFLMPIILFFFVSCKEKEKEINVLSKNTMISVLMDIHLLEAKVEAMRIPKDSQKIAYGLLEQEIFHNLEVDKDEYLESLAYYLSKPKDIKSIYALVVDSLNVRQKRIELKMKEEEKDGENEEKDEAGV